MNFAAKPNAISLCVGALALVLGIPGTSAKADGMAPRGAPVVQQAPTSWSGFYFGAHSGWQWSQIDASATSTATNVGTLGIDHDSPVVGGQIGIQHQFGFFVLGIEGTLTVAYQDDYAGTRCLANTSQCAARFDDVLTIGPRLGWAMGKWMPYLTGGYANAAFAQKLSLNNNSSNPFEDRERHSGWYIGGGVDMAMLAGWTIGLEYRHYEFDNADYRLTRTLAGNNQVGVIQVDGSNSADATSDIVTLRASWKFDRPAPVAAPLK